MIRRDRHRRMLLAGLLSAAILVVVVCPFIGMEAISAWDLLRGTAPSTSQMIFWQIRLPRVCVGFMAGAGLAVCGMAFQAMFRNPLATPFTLGVASGASLGAAVYVRLGLAFSLLSVSGMSVFAFLGALGAICLVYGLTRLRRGFSTATMLLAGIAVTMFFTSLILCMQYISDFTQSFRIVRWLMGGLEVMGYQGVFNLLPLVASGSFILFVMTHELNLLATGDDLAIARGVDVKKANKILFAATSLTVGGIVAICGPIGFIGMMIPHICRMLVGSDHRYLMPASFLLGGLFLTLCDTLARTVIAPAEIPVGVITALLGGPFFIWLLIGRSPSSRSCFED